MPDPASGQSVVRLTVQARAWAAASEELLDRVGVRPGWVCADLGCGPLGVLDLLAGRVGRAGKVFGVDRDVAALSSAVDAMRRHPNVVLLPGLVTRTGLPRASLDLVHARLVCQESGAGPLLDEMVALVRPGGFVVVQEPGREPWEIDPAPPGAVGIRRQVTSRFLRRRSGVGPALLHQFRRRGLVGIRSRRHRLRLRGGHPYATMPAFALSVARPALLAAGRVSIRALDRLADALEAAARDPAVRHRSFPMWQVWGRRPG